MNMQLMRFPREMDLEITTNCNLRCAYCSHFTSAGDVSQDLPTSEWLQFLEELRECTVLTVCLQGGEPFLRDDLPDIIEGIVRNKMRFRMLSNGTLITDEIAAFLASCGRCDGVQVSIDGSGSATHDVFRGSGSFDKALTGLQVLRRHGVPVNVRVTIHRINVDDLDNIARLLLDEIGLASFDTNSASHFGMCRFNAEQVQLTTDDRVRAMESLLRLTERYNGRINAQAGPLAEAAMWTSMEQAREAGLEGLPAGGRLTSCGGPLSKLAVRADGTFLVCAQIPSIELGRMNHDRLIDVWQHHPILSEFRSRRQIPLSHLEFCTDCPYVSFCRGGCPATAYAAHGDPFQPSPFECLRRFKELGGRLPGIEPADGVSGTRE